MSGDSLEAAAGRRARVHGPGARIVGAQKVTVGGIAGVLARKHYEVTVEVPDPTRRRAVGPHDDHAAGLPRRHRGAARRRRRGRRVRRGRRCRRRAPAAAVAGPARADPSRVLPGARLARDRLGPRRRRRPASLPRRLRRGARRPRPAASRAAAPAADRAVSPRRAARAAAAAAAAPPRRGRPATADLSTRTDAFAEIMDDFTFNGIAAPEPARRRAPGDRGGAPRPPDERRRVPRRGRRLLVPPSASPRGAAGDLRPPRACCAAPATSWSSSGAPGDAFRVAAQMASSFGLRSVDAADRRGAILARATGVTRTPPSSPPSRGTPPRPPPSRRSRRPGLGRRRRRPQARRHRPLGRGRPGRAAGGGGRRRRRGRHVDARHRAPARRPGRLARLARALPARARRPPRAECPDRCRPLPQRSAATRAASRHP